MKSYVRSTWICPRVLEGNVWAFLICMATDQSLKLFRDLGDRIQAQNVPFGTLAPLSSFLEGRGAKVSKHTSLQPVL